MDFLSYIGTNFQLSPMLRKEQVANIFRYHGDEVIAVQIEHVPIEHFNNYLKVFSFVIIHLQNMFLNNNHTLRNSNVRNVS